MVPPRRPKASARPHVPAAAWALTRGDALLWPLGNPWKKPNGAGVYCRPVGP